MSSSNISDYADNEISVGCLTDSATGLSRPIKIVDTIFDNNTTVSSLYFEVDNTPIILTATESVVMGNCSEGSTSTARCNQLCDFIDELNDSNTSVDGTPIVTTHTFPTLPTIIGNPVISGTTAEVNGDQWTSPAIFDGNRTHTVTYDRPFTGTLRLNVFVLGYPIVNVYIENISLGTPDTSTLTLISSGKYTGNGYLEWYVQGITSFNFVEHAETNKGSFEVDLTQSASNSFTRCYDTVNGTVTTSDTDIDGQPYTPIGSVEDCEQGRLNRARSTFQEPDVDHDAELGCLTDSATGLSRPIKIIDSITVDGTTTTTYHEADGSLITLSATETVVMGGCASTTSATSFDVEQQVLCAEGERFIRHTQYENGAIVNAFDTTMDMVTPIAVTEAAVERCQPRDAEIVIMCEPDGTRFMRHIIRDLYDNQTTVRDTLNDGFTAHTASGGEEICGCQEIDWVKDLCDTIITPINVPALFANGENLSSKHITFTDGDYTISMRAVDSISLTTIGANFGVLEDKISVSGIPGEATNIQMGIQNWQVSQGEALVTFSENTTIVSGGYTSSGTTATATANGTNAGVVGLPDGTTSFSFEVYRTNALGSGQVTFISFDIPLQTKFQRRFTIACDGTLTTKDYTCDGADYTVQGSVGCCNVEGNSCENPLFTKSSESWVEKLCDVETEIIALDVFSVNTAADQVQKWNGVNNTIIDSYTAPTATRYANASAYDANNDIYYVYNTANFQWHSYDGSDIAAGPTNLGAFSGDAVVGFLNSGSLDPTTGLGYFGVENVSRYEVDFAAGTVTSVPAASTVISSLAIDNDGVAHVATGSSGVGTMDLATGVVTLTGSIAPHIANGLGVDNSGNELGLFGSDAGAQQLVRWTEPDGSDATVLGAFTNAATMAVGDAELKITKVEFQRRYEKDCDGNVTYTDYDDEGDLYTSVGEVGVCTVAEEAVGTEIIVGTLTNISTAGVQTSPANAHEVSISNIGTSNAIVAGVTFPAGATVTYKAYFDNATNTYNRLGPISYDAQTSNLLVSVTP